MKPPHAGRLVRVTHKATNHPLAEGYLVLDTGGLYPYNHKPDKYNLPRLVIKKRFVDFVYPVLTIWPGDKVEVIK